MNEYNFTTNFKDLIAKDKFGNILEENDIIKNQITISQKLNVGDIVKLKDSDYSIEIEYVDYEIPNIGIIDYAGSKIEIPSSRLVLFNQKDIEYKIDTKKNHVR